jgi:hypothetical protein
VGRHRPSGAARRSGASCWGPARHAAYANDLDVPQALIAVHARSNRPIEVGQRRWPFFEERPQLPAATETAPEGRGATALDVSDRGRDTPAPTGFPSHSPPGGDIIFDVMWLIELEPEVEGWLDTQSVKEFAFTMNQLDRLAEQGNRLRMPASRALGDGSFELRFDLGRVARRITFYFAPKRRIVLLTVFRKQRQNERTEVRRAHQAMAQCIDEGHTAEEDR